MGLIALRHPPVNARGLCYGRHAPPLAPDADAHITAAVAATQALPQRPTALLTSPAVRCQPLAAALGEAFGLPPRIDARLQELDFGAWEGRPWDEIPRAESNPWAADPVTRAPPGGESFAALTDRLAAALHGHDGMLLVTHAGPIRALKILSHGISFAQAFATPIPYAEPLPFPALAAARPIDKPPRDGLDPS